MSYSDRIWSILHCDPDAPPVSQDVLPIYYAASSHSPTKGNQGEYSDV